MEVIERGKFIFNGDMIIHVESGNGYQIHSRDNVEKMLINCCDTEGNRVSMVKIRDWVKNDSFPASVMWQDVIGEACIISDGDKLIWDY